jgi:translation initiation factor eIF-2B subunit delta
MINRLVREIERDRAHGAGWLSRRALAVIKTAALESRAENAEGLLAELAELGGRICDAKPSMAPMANQISRCLHESMLLAKKSASVAQLRVLISAAASELERDAEKSALLAAQEGARLISDGDTIITASYSSTVCQALTLARDAGREFRVLAADSSSDTESYGELMRLDMARRGIRINIFPDSEMERAAKKANKAISGADAVTCDGSVINGYPSLALAQAAKNHGIPFYCIGETAKLEARPEVRLEAGFDYIPANLVSGIITEEGATSRRAIASRCRALGKYSRNLAGPAARG